MNSNIRHTSGSHAWLAVLALSLAVVLPGSLAGCGGDDDPGNISTGPYDLTFNGESFGPHEGQMLYVAVVELSSGSIVKRDSAMVSSGGFSFTWQDLLEDGLSYRIDYYADVNSNGECETTDDHIWSASISAVGNNVTLSEIHNLDFTLAACNSFPHQDEQFDLTFSGTGFGPHEGQTIYVVVIRLDNDNVIDSTSTTVVNGSFSIEWPRALEAGKSYRIDYYADVNSNGECETTDDHIWRTGVSNVSSDVSVDEVHSLNFETDACNSFLSS